MNKHGKSNNKKNDSKQKKKKKLEWIRRLNTECLMIIKCLKIKKM